MALFDLPRPAFGHPLHRWAARLANAASEARTRRKLRDVSTLTDAQLRDIGVTRNDIAAATRLPYSHDSAAELQRIAARRTPFR